ncbi:RHS repeat-associated core domain-containing protein [Sedimentisphaera salicampi]|uniref:RHS repeat-associated core domain-containing protein n=1 Tax=Sedimentisphaera salicampi TaxID=1941349 RepID=UPI000B9B8EA9|nr:RHS repeat-associated core domain-containing protein [Sedimentisphaera salicampi]OXU14828.1 putative cell wall-associated polypeptide [Sedimentisphaera salicampi]
MLMREGVTIDSAAETYSADPNDQPLDESAVGNPYMFTGRRYDSESGLYYYRARYYNPALGVFHSRDPLGYIDSMNLYAYCGNNPVNYVDPMGLRKLNKYGGWHFNYQETRDIIKEGEKGDWSPFDHIIVPFISENAKYDYKANNPNRTFTIPASNTAEKKKEDVVSASQFGNYIAGYLAQYHLGTAGWLSMRVGGHLYGYIDGCDYYEIPMVPLMIDQCEPLIWDYESFVDDEDSIRDINRGRDDAINGAWD